MSISTENHRDLVILEQIEKDPESTQASLASQLGVAIGTINWHIKRLVEKGYVKVRHIERRKLRYIITPDGLALRGRLALDYINTSFHLYRLIRERTLKLLDEARADGIEALRLAGEGDVADVVRLTCLEQGFNLVEDGNAPTLRIRELKLFLEKEEAVND